MLLRHPGCVEVYALVTVAGMRSASFGSNAYPQLIDDVYHPSERRLMRVVPIMKLRSHVNWRIIRQSGNARCVQVLKCSFIALDIDVVLANRASVRTHCQV